MQFFGKPKNPENVFVALLEVRVFLHLMASLYTRARWLYISFVIFLKCYRSRIKKKRARIQWYAINVCK